MVWTRKEVHHGVNIEIEEFVQGSDDMGDPVGFRNSTALLDATVCDRSQFDWVSVLPRWGESP